MTQYYTHNGSEQQGPFSIEELKNLTIQQETPIWHEGLSDWTIAGKVDELKELFQKSTPPPFSTKQTIPPPVNKQTPKETIQPEKDRKMGKAILIATGILVVIFGGLFLVSNMNQSGNSNNNGYDSGSYQEKIMTVEEMELSQPKNFLSVSGNYNENFWGDKIKIQGTITNSATVASYKDAIIEVVFYSKTKTILGTENYTIYEVFGPHSEKGFNLKVENYSDVRSIGLNVVNATAY